MNMLGFWRGFIYRGAALERRGMHSHAERGNENAPLSLEGEGRGRGGFSQAGYPWSERLLPTPFALLCLLLFLAWPAFAATIKVTPDRNPVRLNETFNLVFSSEENVDEEPDFSPLEEDFDILGRDQSNQVSIVNGKMSRTQQWTVSLSPKRAGVLAIPSIAFGSDHSPTASLTVLEANATASGGDEEDAELKLEMEAKPKNPYVQAQAILTVRVLLRVNVAGADLSEPALPDALVERLGEDHRYNTFRNGREYAVIERRYAVFPQKSGLLRIDPLRLNAQIEVGGRSFFSRSTRAVQVKSEAVDLKVRPQPPAFTGSHWLPAADLKLEETWPQNPPRAKAGEPVTRTLTVRAEGATVSMLPELGGELHLDPSIKQYPDQPALNEDKSPDLGVSSRRQEKTALIPGKAGEYKLPAVEIPWWNTQTERMEIAKIPERILKIEPSGEAAPQPTPIEAAPQTQGEPPSARPALAGPAQPASPVTANLWFWLALIFGLGWLGTGLAWWLSRRHQPPPATKPPRKEWNPDKHATQQALRRVCLDNDPAAARRALLNWAQAGWPGQRPATLGEVARLGGASLSEEIARLNRALYSSGSKDWQGEGLWEAVAALDSGTEKASGEAFALEPLYR